jgi:hypothetical protein
MRPVATEFPTFVPFPATGSSMQEDRIENAQRGAAHRRMDLIGTHPPRT